MANTSYNDNLKYLYDSLVADGYDMGSIEETAEAIRTDEGNRRHLYNTGIAQGYDMGSYEEFEEALGLPKFQAPLKYGEEPIAVSRRQKEEVAETPEVKPTESYEFDIAKDPLAQNLAKEAEESEQPDYIFGVDKEKYNTEPDYLTSEMPEAEVYDYDKEALRGFTSEFKKAIKEKYPYARQIGFAKPVQITMGGPAIGPSALGSDVYMTVEDRQRKAALDEQKKLGQITSEQYEQGLKEIMAQSEQKYNEQFSDDTMNASAALHLLSKAQNKIKRDAKRGGKMGIWTGLTTADYAGINPVMTAVDASASFRVLSKLQNDPNAELTESEEELLQAIVTYNAVDDTFVDTMWQRIGAGLPETAGYMAMFALTQGAGGAVGAAAKEGVKKALKLGMKNAERRLYAKGFKGFLQKAGDRVINTAIPGIVNAGTAAATQTVMNPVGLVSGTLERMAGEAEYATVGGIPVATGEVTGQEKLGAAIYKEFGAQFWENFSERSGESLDVILGGVKGFGRAVGESLENVDAVKKAVNAFEGVVDAAKKTKVGDLVLKAADWVNSKDLGKLAEAVGWNGAKEEFYEEIVNGVGNAIFVGDDKLSEVFKNERLLETFLSVYATGGALRLLHSPVDIHNRAEVRKEKQKLNSYIKGIESKYAKNDAVGYTLQAVANAVNTGTMEDVTRVLSELNKQYHFNAETAQDLLNYASSCSMRNMWRSNDNRQASEISKSVYAEVDARTNKQSGVILTAELVAPDGSKQNVDVVDGLVITSGKAVDGDLSDRSVVVRFADGTTKMVSSKSLGNVVSETNPSFLRDKMHREMLNQTSSEFNTEWSSGVNKYGVHFHEDGTLDYNTAEPAQIALTLRDEQGGVGKALQYATQVVAELTDAASTEIEGGEGVSIFQHNALSKWRSVAELLQQMANYEAAQAQGATTTPEGEAIQPPINEQEVSATAPATALRKGDRIKVTTDDGEVVSATVAGKEDGQILLDFDDIVTIGGQSAQSMQFPVDKVAGMIYTEQIQEGTERIAEDESESETDEQALYNAALGRIPLKNGQRDWTSGKVEDVAFVKLADNGNDFDKAIAFAEQMAQNCAAVAQEMSQKVISVEDPTNADQVAAATAERDEMIAVKNTEAMFWQRVADYTRSAKDSYTSETAPQTEAPVQTEAATAEEVTPEAEMPLDEEGEPDFVAAGPERSAEFLREEYGEEAGSFIEVNIAAAQKAVAEAEAKKPQSTKFSEHKKELAAIAEEKATAKANLDFWEAVKANLAAPVAEAVAEETAPTETVVEEQPEVVESAEQPATATEEQPAEEVAQPEVVEEVTPAEETEEAPAEVSEVAEEKAEENKEVSDVNSEKDTNFVEESEATPEETTEEEITVEMIENTDLDEVIKVMAIDYLNGNVNVATKAAYDAVKDYVRNISTVRPADSTDAGRAQLGEGADDAGSLASGQSRGVSGDLDSREDGGVVSDGDGVRSEAGEDDLAEPSGIGSDNSVGTGGHEPDVVSGIVSSGRVRSGSDSERRPSSRNPRRGKGSSNGVSAQNEGGRGETQRGGDTRDSQEREVKEQEVKDDLARHIQELKDILANPMGEAKGALLDVTSVFGMFGVNAIKVMGATAKIGMDLVKLGYYKFKKWSAAMHENLDGVFHSQTELTDELIDEFIRAMWDTSFKYRGEVRKISEWASLLEAEQLRAMMRMGIEEKRKLQKAAENEPTILGDIENIRKSLPFLLPAQQEDVEKAEFQFFDESHKDAAYGYGKGYMFTNGTGTGKTYTGLGIIKRFIKQGKGRILIVTASGEKIDDWVKDAKNLGITATRLADTKSKGKGVVVTQYANLRQNYELLKDEFDLIVYDESHKLMENQAGEDTNAAAAHYMITNRDAEQAILRTLQDTPLWKEPRKLEEELKELVSLLDAKKLTSEQLKRAEQLGGKVVMEERVSAIRARLTEIAKLQEAEVKKQLQDPNKRAAAEAAVARTKVVFLSATPFNTALNLDYVEGYIFSYPTEEGKERDREKDKERFIMDKFPSSHRRAKQGVVRIDETQIQDADAVTAEEIAFSDYLQNSLHTMSGRGLDSEWDYSREFPKLEVTGARLVNAAIAALTTGKYSALRPYFKHLLDDYAQSTAFFEVIKTSASIERIKEHIALGRKVVVFHRRMSSTEPLEPPFARGLDNADHDDRASSEMIHAFRREFAELLAWEQSLDYRFPQDILMEAFATEEEKAKYQKEQEEYGLKLMNHALGIEKRKPKAPKLRSARVGVFNGNETEAEKHKAVDAFNTDGSECSLLVVQVAAGKEGISLHDKTGKHQRVMMSMQLPQSPIEFVQAEGRIYRVGNKSNAIFEYPVLGIDQEIIGFAAKINGRAATTENLALGSRARGLRNSISRAMLASREIPVSPTQGVGGKQLDSREEWEKTDYDGAIEAYNNRNTESEATTDFNEQDTPEPIGYKMMEWARPEAGESILEPAAGTGTMAQYAPQKSRLTAIEIITKKFATLITKVGGSGRKLLNEDFMGFAKHNKFDCVVMNTPHTGEVAVNALIAPQGVPQKEFEFLDKVFGHINEGGRVVALIEEKNADATIKAVTNLGRNRVVVGEVKLPAFAFPNANGGTATRVVVFDVVSNEALRSAMPEKVSFDLSGETTPQGLFEAMRDVQMPERTIDKVARLAKKLQKFEAKFKSFKNVVQRGKNYRTGKMEQEVNFDADRAFLSVRTAQGGTYRIGVGGYYFNLYIRGNEIAAGNMGEITNLCNVYKSLKQITDAQTDEEFRYLTRNYEPKTYPEIRDFLEVCKDAIRTALGKTESQIINIAEGRVENELRGELTFKQMKDAFEGLSHGDVTLDDLSKKVFEVVGKIEGLRFYTKSGLPGSTVAYYTPKENAIVINEDTWNSLRLTDGIKAQTVVHEMIHAVTSYYLRQYELGVRFGEEINQACQDILDVYKAITSDRSFEAGLMQGSKQGDNATYGLTSVEEMIAELANPKFRVQLKLKKLWRQLVNGIKKLLGINLEMGDAQEATALETLENALDTLLSNYNPEAYKNYVGLANAMSDSQEFVDFRTSEEISQDYPNWLEGTTTDSGKHTTQVEGTRKTYKKVGDWIAENMGMETSVLDASSGMGYGTQDLRDRGFNIEDVEPYQSEERKQNNPATYSSYGDIKKEYDFIISNAVLNVIPDDWRADVLHNMASHLREGGKLFINTRKAGEEKSIKDKIELDSAQEVLVKRNGRIASYQRFFTPSELKEYVENELGEGYTVEVANMQNSGTSGLAAVVVTKNEATLSERSGADAGNSSSEGLLEGGNVHLSRQAFTRQQDAAKIEKNTATTKQSLSRILREGGITEPLATPQQAVRALGKGLKLRKSASSLSYYGDLYEGDFDVNNTHLRLRLSTHPANGAKFGNVDAEHKVSVVILKNGKHQDRGPHNGFEEYVYDPNRVSLEDAANAILNGVAKLLETGEYGNESSLAEKKEYPTYEAGNAMYRTKAEYTDSERAVVEQGQTRTREEIEAYINAVAAQLPGGVKVVITNSAESGDSTHTGWYDMTTDTVYINADMCDNEADVDATFVHELVGHRSMPSAIARVIGSKNIADRITLYTKLSRMLPEELKAKVMAKTAAGMDLGVAVDEVLAEEVETANLVKPDLWSRICAEVRALFRKVFNRGLSLSDNDIKYMFWLSANNLGKDAMYRAEGILHRLGAGRFKRNSAVGTTEQMEYDEAVVSQMAKGKEQWIDSLNPLKKLQETVAKHHGELKSFEDAYNIELSRASRTMARFNMMSERYIKPVVNAISALTNNGTTREEVGFYMIAKHGLERNAYYREQSRQELNDKVLERIKEAAANNELSVAEVVALVLAEYENEGNYFDKAEMEGAVEFYRQNLGEKYEGDIVGIEAIPIKDYSGLTGLMEELSDDPDMKDFTQFAEEFVEEFEGRYVSNVINTLWDKIRDLSTAALTYQMEGGIISQEMYNKLRGMYRYYVPLRGWHEDTSDMYYDYTRPAARFQTVVKTANGRKSLADDPLANMANMLQSAVTIVEKNASKQAFVRMAMNHPESSLVQLVRLRYEKRKNPSTGKTEWEPVYPDYKKDATTEEINEAIAQYNERTKEMVANGEAIVRRSQVDVGVKVKPANLDDHYVKAMFNGEEVAVIVNGDPAAARALNGTNAPAYEEDLQKHLGRATRYMAQINTTYSPKFVMNNLTRDYMFSSFSASVKHGKTYSRRFQKNVRKALTNLPGLIANGASQLTEEQLDNFDAIDKDILRYFMEFVYNGGETGFSRSMSTEEWKKNLDKQVKAISEGKDTEGILRAVLGFMKSANRWAEDIPRFAAYMTSRQMGKNISESIKDAKEISVNFARHGAGGMGNTVIRKLYPFVNAGIQGLYNMATLAKEHPARFWGNAACMIALGALMPLAAISMISIDLWEKLIGDDDDDDTKKANLRNLLNYEYMSKYITNNRLVIPTRNGFITLPIPHELVPFYALGNIATRRFLGYDEDIPVWEDIAGVVLSVAPLDFISGTADGVNLRDFIPTAVQPLYDVFQNEDYMGNPIYRSYDYGKGNNNRNDAGFTKAPIGTWWWLTETSRLLSNATGGDGIIRPGLSDFHISNEKADVQLSNPAIIQYLLEQYLGGMISSANRVVNIGKGVYASATGDENAAEKYFSAYNMPFVSGLWRNSKDSSADARIDDVYDKLAQEGKNCKRIVNAYKSYADTEDFGKIAKDAERLIHSEEYMVMTLFDVKGKEIAKYEKALREAYEANAPKEDIDNIKALIRAEKLAVIDALSGINLRKGATEIKNN
jgi:SAM-dependent methyltransferase